MQVGSHTYQITPLGVFDQFDIARRVAPIITLLVTQKDREKLKAGFARAFVSMAAGISREDGQAILTLCLSCVKRKDHVGFAPISVAGKLQYSDIDLEQSLELLWGVLVESKIIDFFDVPGSSSKE
jgi:hypothetical protein